MNRCPGCRTRRATFVSLLKHIAASGHKHCTCGGYHYKHRPNSPLCYQNTMAEVRHAQRAGEPLEVLLEIEIDCAWSKPGRIMKEWK